jgi:hypothetical protein
MKSLTLYPNYNQIYLAESLRKGHEFEDYIITLFNQRKFKLIEWRSDKKASNGAYPESCTYPDLELAFMGRRKHRFAIECKWREQFKNGKLKWTYQKQLNNYIAFQQDRNIPVFIAIGIGGLPKDPEKLFVTPLQFIKEHLEVYENDLIPYRRNPTHKFYYNTLQLKLF